ncbi:ATP-dependent DNA helicase [Trichonephila clavipes]|nr:ATP-dependent DNA helicase [Trichonephila clavipes]
MHLDFTAEHYNEALIMIEDLCLAIANKVLNQLGMPSPTRSAAASFDAELRREQNYNITDLLSYVSANISKLTLEQKGIYDQIMQTINSGNGKIFFLDTPGGTAGIAVTLLPGGRTAHSALKLPLNIQIIETPICNISKSSGMGKVLQKCKLIVWDECTMAHKKIA